MAYLRLNSNPVYPVDDIDVDKSEALGEGLELQNTLADKHSHRSQTLSQETGFTERAGMQYGRMNRPSPDFQRMVGYTSETGEGRPRRRLPSSSSNACSPEAL